MKVTGVGATRAVTVGAGTYVGTQATAGLVGVNGGVTRGGGGDMGGVWVIGDTTFTGLWGLGRTKGGGALTVGGEGREGLVFVAPADANGGFVVELEGGDVGGVGVTSILDSDAGGAAEGAATFKEVGVMVETVTLRGFWAGLSGGTGSGGAGAAAGEAPPPVKYNHKLTQDMFTFLRHYGITSSHVTLYLLGPG